MIAAVDIGNSRTKIGFFEERPESGPKKVPRLIGTCTDIERLKEIPGVRPDHRINWTLASVNDSNLAVFRNTLERLRAEDSIRELNYSDVPMQTEVRYPEKLGIDRLLAACAALKIYGKGPLLVIDLGTAITVDLVSETGRFLGGSIFPGVRLLLDSLYANTDKLPKLEFDPRAKPDFPARNTEDAIRTGIANFVIGGIRELLETSKTSFDETLPLIVSGGDSGMLELIEKSFESPVVLVPDLVLYGIAVST